MSSKLLILLAFFVLNALCKMSWGQRYTISLAPGQIYSAYVTIPANIQSNVTLTMGNQYPVAVCFQEFAMLNGDLTSCNGAYQVVAAADTFVFVGDRFVSPKDLENFDNVVLDNDNEADTQSSVVFTTLRSVSYYVYFQNMETGNSSYTVNTVAYLEATLCNEDNEYGPLCSTVKDQYFNSSNSVEFYTSTYHPYYSVEIQKFTSEIMFMASLWSDVADSVDVTIYARRSAIPSTTEYDVMGVNMFNLTNPLPGMWYMIFSNSEVDTYFVQGSAINCGNYSIYSNGECVSLNVTDLTYAYNNVTSEKASNSYDYYIVSNNTLVLGVGTSAATNIAPPIYTSYLSIPDNTTYMVASTNQTVNFFSLTAIPSLTLSTEATTWIIAVWSDENYMIWANQYCPKNCSSKGNCTEANGTCICNKGYKGLYCQTHGLPLIVIILIAIGAAIILAIVIGVPVACYIRNSRKANYERV